MRSVDTNLNTISYDGPDIGTDKTSDELTEGPPDGKDGQKVLVRGRDELY